jgi:hypothetical protein
LRYREVRSHLKSRKSMNRQFRINKYQCISYPCTGSDEINLK